jgi:hypothetical protein
MVLRKFLHPYKRRKAFNTLQAGAIITARFIMIIAALIISKDDYFVAWPCAKIETTLDEGSLLLSSYPACAAYVNGTNPQEFALVKASMDGPGGGNAGAALNVTFGMALWLAVAIHAIGVEVYVSFATDNLFFLCNVNV